MLPETAAAASKGGMNWRVELDQVESYRCATRSQPSCSNSVKRFIAKQEKNEWEKKQGKAELKPKTRANR